MKYLIIVLIAFLLSSCNDYQPYTPERDLPRITVISSAKDPANIIVDPGSIGVMVTYVNASEPNANVDFGKKPD